VAQLGFLLFALGLASGGMGLWRALRLAQANHWSALGDGYLFWISWAGDAGRNRLVAAAVLVLLIVLGAWALEQRGFLRTARFLWLWRKFARPLPILLAVFLVALPRVLAPLLRPEPGDRPSVVMILLDTVRLDFVGWGRATRAGAPDLDLTPHLDALARRGAFFTQAVSQAPWTKPSVATIFTGLTPSHHLAVGRPGRGYYPVLPPGRRTLAEAFAGAGFATNSITTNWNISRAFGFDQGFEGAVEGERSAREVLDLARGWLAGRTRPFFLYLHLNDAHYPYRPRPPYKGMFDHSGSSWELDGAAERAFRLGERKLSPADLEHLRMSYAEQIRYLDDQVGAFVEEILQGRKNVLVVLVSDHGEEFLDHGDLGHAHTLFDELLRVPLMFNWSADFPAMEKGLAPGEVSRQVRLMDLAPTLLEIAGLPWPAAADPPDGKSLLPLWGLKSDRAAFSETDMDGSPRSGFTGPLRSWRLPEAKWIQSAPEYARKHGFPLRGWYFDLAKDPLEKKNLAASRLPGMQELRAALESSGFLVEKPPAPLMRIGMTPEQMSNLAELGYGSDLSPSSPDLEQPSFLPGTVPWAE